MDSSFLFFHPWTLPFRGSLRRRGRSCFSTSRPLRVRGLDSYPSRWRVEEDPPPTGTSDGNARESLVWPPINQ